MTDRVLGNLSPLEHAMLALDAPRRSALRILVAGRKANGPGDHEQGMAEYIAAGWGGHTVEDVMALLPRVCDSYNGPAGGGTCLTCGASNLSHDVPF